MYGRLDSSYLARATSAGWRAAAIQRASPLLERQRRSPPTSIPATSSFRRARFNAPLRLSHPQPVVLPQRPSAARPAALARITHAFARFLAPAVSALCRCATGDTRTLTPQHRAHQGQAIWNSSSTQKKASGLQRTHGHPTACHAPLR